MKATSEHAGLHWRCPIARIRADVGDGHCHGAACPLWRWSTAGVWKDAVQAEAQRLGEKAPFARAAASVAADPAGFGCLGYCGLGGA